MPADVAVHARRLPPAEPFAALVRLFLLGLPLEVGDAEAALRPLDLQALVRSGWLGRDGGGVRATLKVVPHGDLLIASDRETEGPTSSDWVAGIHPPSVTLAKLTVRREVARALDVATGNGVQALLAARHAGSVVATDVNRRALAVAAINARLNDVAGLELRQGSYFEPVGGERFDLVTCNPPYVISPEARYAYRDSGLERDDVSRRVVEAAAGALREGGFAHVLVSWAHTPGDWSTPLEQWVASSGCDCWLLHFGSDDPVTHAAEWLRPVAHAEPAEFEAALARWLEYLERHGVEAIAHGAVILRRRSGARNWTRRDTCPLDRLEQAGDHILRVFESQDFLDALAEPRRLLDARLALVETHHLEQTLVCRDGRTEPTATIVSLDDGLSFRLGLDEHTAALLPHFDGRRPLGEVLAAAGAAGLEDAALPAVRRLVELGLLARVDTAGPEVEDSRRP